MKLRHLLPLLGLLGLSLNAQTAPGLKKIAISDIKPTAAISESVAKAGRSNSLDRVIQSLDSQLLDRVHNTRKFEVLARSDMGALLKEADFAGSKFQINGVDYLLVATVSDFQDFAETREFAALGKKASWRVIRMTIVGKIFEGGTNRLIESANIPIEAREQNEIGGNATSNGDLSDALLQQVAANGAEPIANRVADVIFPPKILSKLDRQITINRGEGTGMVPGQTWEVFALGEELVDPDTGVSLGKEELNVGRVRITRVNPKSTQAEILEDTGVDKGAILRPASR